MNTIVATTRRVPRVGLIGIVVLIAAFAALMAVRVIGSSSSSVTAPAQTSLKLHVARTHAAPAKATIVLLPDLPTPIASKLLYSKVVVVSLYTGSSSVDRAAVAEARNGAHQIGAAFTAINVLDETQARAIAKFGGPTDSPSVLIVKRPGKIVAQFTGTVDGTIVAQAAHNAGAGS